MPIIIAIIAITLIGGAVYLFTADDTTPVANQITEEPQARSEDSGGNEEIITDNTAEPLAPTDAGDVVASDDNTYTVSSSYLTPARTSHEIAVTLTVADGVITEAQVVYDNGEGYSNPNQERFDGAYKAEVIGKPIDSIALSRVGGASLTSGAFNEAVAKIAAQL